MHRIVRVEVLPDYKLRLEFSDGVRGVADVSHLVGKGVFALWDDYDAFRQVRIGESGELCWGDRIDLCPDSLYLRTTNQEPDDIFPGLRQDLARA